jgi:hypothetical protein
VRAAFAPAQFDTFESRSRQFVVTGLRPGVFIGMPDGSKPPTNFVRLEPAVVTVNCERIKESFLRELRLPDQWRGRIRVVLVPDALPTQAIQIHRDWFSDGWQFRVMTPHHVEPPVLARAIVGALLIELANRNNASQRPGDVPLWAVEGLAEHLVHTGGVVMLDGASASIPTGRLGVVVDPRAILATTTRLTDAYSAARAALQGTEPLSFANLSLPRPGQLTGASAELFRHSAHVFVGELLRQPDGPAQFVSFIAALPSFLNAQLAFEHAFKRQFATPLDIEKWWSAALAHVLSRDGFRRWTPSASLQRLDELLRAHVQVRGGTNALPERRAIKLQEFLGQAEFKRERVAVAELVAQLTALQAQSPPDLARLIGDYRTAFTAYLKRREQAGQLVDLAGKPAPSHKVVVQETIKQLDLLDVIRNDFRAVGAGPPVVSAQ